MAIRDTLLLTQWWGSYYRSNMFPLPHIEGISLGVLVLALHAIETFFCGELWCFKKKRYRVYEDVTEEEGDSKGDKN